MTIGNQKTNWLVFLILFLLICLLGFFIYLISNRGRTATQITDNQVPLHIETQVEIEQEPEIVTNEGLTTRTFLFEYDCQIYSLSLPLYQSMYDYFSTLDKAVNSQEYSKYDLLSKYYDQFIQSEHDEVMVELIIDTIGNLTSAYTSDDLATAIISFVQNIEYDCEKFFSYENQENHDYQTNYPYETLYLNQGVCGDSTILLAKILKQLGYGTAFLLFEEENHMALGIQCPNVHADYVQNGVGYCYIETTAPSRIGVIPIEIADSNVPNTHRIIKISDGSTFMKMNNLADQMEIDSNEYGPFILALSRCDDIKRYKRIHDQENKLLDYEEKLVSLKSEIEPSSKNLEYLIQQYYEMGCKGTVSKSKYKKCETERKYLESLQYTHEALVIDYNNLVEDYNDLLSIFTDDIKSFEELISSYNSNCSGLTIGGESLDIPTIIEE